MRKLIHLGLLIPFFCAGQLYIPSNGLIHISDGAEIDVGGDLENNGVIQNRGMLTLYGDWTANSNFSSLEGELRIWGGADQTVLPSQLTMSKLTMNQDGIANFTGTSYLVLDEMDLQFGIIRPGENTEFILGPNARVNGGSAQSYFDGTLITQGSGIKEFPIGAEGLYAPLTLLNVFGVNTEIAASFQMQNTFEPVPGDSLIGVSHRGLWELEVVRGNTDPTQVELVFSEEDLTDFRVTNDIRFKVSAPIVAMANNPAGAFESLGMESLTNTDSITFGTIISEEPVSLDQSKKYLAIGLAPSFSNEGLFFIPEAFSPRATDPRNQRFRIFGQSIQEEGFDLRVYNKYGSLVYMTDSFQEANQTGWGGKHMRTNTEEPDGVYYYAIKFQFITGLPVEKKGAFYLVR